MLKEAGVDTGELLHQRQPNLGFHCNKSETKLIGNYETLSRNFTINFFRLIMINLLRKFCKCKKKNMLAFEHTYLFLTSDYEIKF